MLWQMARKPIEGITGETARFGSSILNCCVFVTTLNEPSTFLRAYTGHTFRNQAINVHLCIPMDGWMHFRLIMSMKPKFHWRITLALLSII